MSAEHQSSSPPAPLGLVIKSYLGDYQLFVRLMASIVQFNKESLPVWVVVPDSDLEQFGAHDGPHCEVLSESVLGRYLTTHEVSGIRPGYINQEIIKMAFWELGLAENYFAIDSDAVVLRPFGVADFLHPDGTPYTVLVEDRDLLVDPEYYQQHWVGREISLRHIQSEVGLEDPRLLTCHGHQVMSSVVWRSFKNEFMEPRGLSYADILAIEPYEFSWYNFWLQKSKVIEIHGREPIVKVIHNRGQHEEMLLRGITLEDYARGYLALVVNSNFGTNVPQADRAVGLARYLSVRDLWSILLVKLQGLVKRSRK